MRAESAVEPTKSENITVTWRRSAAVSLADSIVEGASGSPFAVASVRRAVIASNSARRCPTMLTPISFRSSAVKFGRTFSLISFSRNAPSYLSRPRVRSHPPMSMMAPSTTNHLGLSSLADESSTYRAAQIRIGSATVFVVSPSDFRLPSQLGRWSAHGCREAARTEDGAKASLKASLREHYCA